MDLFKVFRKKKDLEDLGFIAVCHSCKNPITTNQSYVVRGQFPVARYTHIECGLNPQGDN